MYQLVQPTGPFAGKQGPLDAQCKFLQILSYLDFSNANIGMVMHMFESTSKLNFNYFICAITKSTKKLVMENINLNFFLGLLVHSYISNVERIKCVNIGERLNPTSNLFSGIFASVLGSDSNKQDRPVSWDILLVALLKLLAKLVQTPLPGTGEPQQEAMDTESAGTSQTDESKVEQIQQERSSPPVPCLADNVLQHRPSIIRLCQSLSVCKASSLSMLANISQQV